MTDHPEKFVALIILDLLHYLLQRLVLLLSLEALDAMKGVDYKRGRSQINAQN